MVVRDAATVLGGPFGYELRHDPAARRITIDITQPPPADVRFVFPCRFGAVRSATADGVAVPITGTDVRLPAGLRRAVVDYG